MNKDRPMMIWLAGETCNCRALRTKDSTITTRVKQVINNRIEGASDSRVSEKRILIPMSTFCVPLLPPSVMETGPKPVEVFVCAVAVSAPNTSNSGKNQRQICLLVLLSPGNLWQPPHKLRAG